MDIGREVRKSIRNLEVSKIVITIMRGETQLNFDGDEISQRRMFMYSQRMRANNRVTIPWVMADNSVIEVTADELESALDMAMETQGNLWFI